MKTGKDLIALWYKPGKYFTDALAYINEVDLDWEELVKYLDEISRDTTIQPHAKPVLYRVFITADTLEEQLNLNSVIATMEEVMKTPTVVWGTVMPDACHAGPIGTIPVWWVVVTRNAIHPGMHSADICCSVMATNFWKIDPKIILDKAESITHFWFLGRQDTFPMNSVLDNLIKWNRFLNSKKMQEYAKYHLGTQWDGNHFLFVWVSQATWDTYMVTHHWSRGFWAGLYKQGMEIAEKYRKELSPKTLKQNAWIPADSQDGKDYWDALQIVRSWTKQNHLAIHNAIGLPSSEIFWNEHNFVFKDVEYYIHAKWSTPLEDKFVPDSTNGLRLIPMNMSEPVLIVRWKWFAPHWAGRNLSRTQHMKSQTKTIDEIIKEETKWLDIRFFWDPDISELPSAYKNAQSVRSDMEKYGLGEIVDQIMPYWCIMAGNQKKPWEK